jgi:hypothetical protein
MTHEFERVFEQEKSRRILEVEAETRAKIKEAFAGCPKVKVRLKRSVATMRSKPRLDSQPDTSNLHNHPSE